MLSNNISSDCQGHALSWYNNCWNKVLKWDIFSNKIMPGCQDKAKGWARCCQGHATRYSGTVQLHIQRISFDRKTNLMHLVEVCQVSSRWACHLVIKMVFNNSCSKILLKRIQACQHLFQDAQDLAKKLKVAFTIEVTLKKASSELRARKSKQMRWGRQWRCCWEDGPMLPGREFKATVTWMGRVHPVCT